MKIAEARVFLLEEFERILKEEGCKSEEKAIFCKDVSESLLFSDLPRNTQCVVDYLQLSIIAPNGKEVKLIKLHETFKSEGYLGKYYYTYLFRIFLERLRVVEEFFLPPQV